ncbi:MAG: response regulator [Gammaproteobacteria bacterium]|nr:response regulator [Gammaproteobacteria bacterium]
MNEKAKPGIMLVEDDVVDVMTVKRAFKKVGINNPMYVANDGLVALEMLRGTSTAKINERPKIVLLDLNMPRMSGLEFLEELRKDPDLKSIVVFVLTTSRDHRDREEAYNHNVAGYIVKPVEQAEFVDSVKKMGEYWNLIEMPD